MDREAVLRELYQARARRDIDGDRAVVAVHQVVRNLDGEVMLETDVTHTYTFRGDLVAAMEVTSGSPPSRRP